MPRGQIPSSMTYMLTAPFQTPVRHYPVWRFSLIDIVFLLTSMHSIWRSGSYLLTFLRIGAVRLLLLTLCSGILPASCRVYMENIKCIPSPLQSSSQLCPRCGHVACCGLSFCPWLGLADAPKSHHSQPMLSLTITLSLLTSRSLTAV